VLWRAGCWATLDGADSLAAIAENWLGDADHLLLGLAGFAAQNLTAIVELEPRGACPVTFID
jgi:hypothetical protein